MRIIDVLRKLVFPPEIKCVLCGKDLPEGRLCNACFPTLFSEREGRCVKCGRAIFGEGKYCMSCKDNEYSFERVLGAFDYTNSTVGLIYNFKFGNGKYLAKFFADEMAKKADAFNVHFDCIVSVPVTDKVKKKRGFNQSYLMAKRISETRGISLSENLVKTRDTEEQARLDYKARATNLERAFAVPDKKEFIGKRVLLIDDVYTTGATSNECAKAILKAGALEVYVLVAAVTPQRTVVEKQI